MLGKEHQGCIIVKYRKKDWFLFICVYTRKTIYIFKWLGLSSAELTKLTNYIVISKYLQYTYLPGEEERRDAAS